jgi:hypothetical protein
VPLGLHGDAAARGEVETGDLKFPIARGQRHVSARAVTADVLRIKRAGVKWIACIACPLKVRWKFDTHRLPVRRPGDFQEPGQIR